MFVTLVTDHWWLIFHWFTYSSRQLGFSWGQPTQWSYFGDVPPNSFSMVALGCNGTEAGLQDCSYTMEKQDLNWCVEGHHNHHHLHHYQLQVLWGLRSRSCLPWRTATNRFGTQGRRRKVTTCLSYVLYFSWLDSSINDLLIDSFILSLTHSLTNMLVLLTFYWIWHHASINNINVLI